MFLDDGKAPRPVVTRSEGRNDASGDLLGSSEPDAKQNNAAGRRKPVVEGELSKVFIKGQHDSVLLDGSIQNDPVIDAWHLRLYPYHVVSSSAKGADDSTRRILIDEQVH